MPARVSSSASARTANKSKQNGATPQRSNRRVVRRRGRARGDLDSDEEIEREARTDSDSDDDDDEEDDLSSLDGSSSDSDTEPVSEDVPPNRHARVLTPSTSQSPGETAEDVKVNDQSSFFAASGTWSEMVADETLNGPADLPVIDFAQLDSQSFPTTTPPRKTKKTKKSHRPAPSSSSAAVPPSPVPAAEEATLQSLDSPVSTPASSSRGRPFQRRAPGQSARQAYQQRLEADPSYVPVVGDFWSHDDRLMDKELRSLSNWWRGRWQGRGRGRGLMRVRGGFAAFGRQGQEGQADGEDASQVPPVDRAWGHDGFEEMRKMEDRRRSIQDQQQQRQAHSPTGFRGGFVGARGRGGFAGARGVRGGRGAFSPSFRGRGIGQGHSQDRVWYAMKPEFMWTKQQDSFLYNDSHSKSRLNQSTGVRIKLPGAKEVVVEVKSSVPSTKPSSEPVAPVASSSVAGSDVGERTMVVRLPKREASSKVVEIKASEPTDTSLDDVFKVRPRLVSPKPIPIPEPSPGSSQPVVNGMPPVDPIVQQKLEQVSISPQESDPVRYAQTEEAVLRRPPSSDDNHQQQQPQVHHPVPSPSEQRPSLLPLQTNFVQPPSQGSPAYGSPYAYPASLPPGLAMNSVGVPYEIATGRPVYIPPPNMPTMYTPPPMMQPPPPHFVPGHMHHHSAMSSSDFLPPGTPPSGYMEYAPMAPPMFSFPRQSSGIKIRAPDGNPVNIGSTSPGTTSGSVKNSNSSTRSSKPTHLRHNAAVFEPSKLGSNDADSNMPGPTHNSSQEYFPQYDPNSNLGYDQYSHDYSGGENGTPGDDSQQQEQMMGYQPYPQYYYPESYGYNPYLDMSQVGQYEAYPPDQTPHGTVYYQ